MDETKPAYADMPDELWERIERLFLCDNESLATDPNSGVVKMLLAMCPRGIDRFTQRRCVEWLQHAEKVNAECLSESERAGFVDACVAVGQLLDRARAQGSSVYEYVPNRHCRKRERKAKKENRMRAVAIGSIRGKAGT